MSSEKFANAAQTTLDGAIDDTTTSVVVTSATAFPTAGNFRILVGTEIMLVTGVSGDTFTVTRGVESTVAAAHVNNRVVTCVLTKSAIDSVKLEVTGFNGVALRTDAGAAAAYGDVPPIGGALVYTEQASAPGYRPTHPVYAGSVDVTHYGAVSDWNGTTGTDNVAAFTAALAALRSRSTHGGAGPQNFTGKLIADGHFYFSDTLHIRQSVILQGSGRAPDIASAVGRAGPGTMFVFPEDCNGVYVHGADTADVSGPGTAIRDLAVFCKDTRTGGGAGTNGAWPPAGHTGNGILIEAPCIVDNVFVFGFAEDGIRAQGGTGFNGGVEGTSLSNCFSYGNGRHGYAFFGNDGHVNLIQTCNATKCWGYGFYDDSGVGNTWINCLAQENSGVIDAAGGWLSDAQNHDYATGPTWAGFNSACFISCYTEGAPPKNEINFPAGATGGILGDPEAISEGSTGFSMSSSGRTGSKPIIWRKNHISAGIELSLGSTASSDVAIDISPYGVPGSSAVQIRQNQPSIYTPSGWWSIDHQDGSEVGLAHVIRIGSNIAVGRFYQRAPWMPHGVLLGSGSGLDPDQQLQVAAATPLTVNDRGTGFTYEKGDVVWNTGTPEAYAGSICTVAGTQDALGAITGTITSGTAALVVNDATGLYRGAYITIATVAGVYKITDVTGLNITITPVAASGAVAQAIDYSPATFRTFGAP